jgi:glycosyltransferase involved in cell wall biosynthesis
VLGDGVERAALETRARELSVIEHVRFIGFQPDPLPYYAAADVYLRTMVFEAQNLSFYLAMAVGLPVVGFDTSREVDLINKVGNGILVPNKDSAALAAAVGRILMLPDRGQSMGELGTKYCREFLDMRRAIAEVCSAYVELHKVRRTS